ncbi:MAG TPA: YncE family protein [Bryobacteraceae bacterium]|nr:YncE family protein [Bryobacteraceae bacterium]
MLRLRSILLIVLFATFARAQSSLAIVEKKAGKVGFYTVDGRRTGEVQVGAYPHEMAFSPDHRFLYVSDNGMLWMTDKGEGGNSITIVDVEARRKVGTIDLGNLRRPHGIAVLPETGEIVVTIENPFGLLRINPQTRSVVRKYAVGGDSPHMVTLGPGNRTAWVSDSGSGAVTVIDLKTGVVEASVPTGKNPQGSALSPDGKLIFVTNNEGGSISIINTESHKIEVEEGPNNSNSGAFLRKAGHVRNQYFWHPFFDFNSSADSADFEIELRLPREYKATTSLPQTERIEGNERVITGKSVRPTFALTLVYDRD